MTRLSPNDAGISSLARADLPAYRIVDSESGLLQSINLGSRARRLRVFGIPSTDIQNFHVFAWRAENFRRSIHSYDVGINYIGNIFAAEIPLRWDIQDRTDMLPTSLRFSMNT